MSSGGAIRNETMPNQQLAEELHKPQDFDVENDDKDPKFDVGGHVRISKYKNIFVKS